MPTDQESIIALTTLPPTVPRPKTCSRKVTFSATSILNLPKTPFFVSLGFGFLYQFPPDSSREALVRGIAQQFVAQGMAPVSGATSEGQVFMSRDALVFRHLLRDLAHLGILRFPVAKSRAAK